ncbi:prepilin peptidase, partial [Aquifex sp.]
MNSEIFTYLAVFLFGLIFGSFYNVLIYRLPRNISVVFPPSHCPHCKQRLKWYDNIPLLSFLILKGRC